MQKFYQFLLIKQYLFYIWARLLYSTKRKREIIKDFRQFIYSCIRENPEDKVTCKQDLYDLFGTVDIVVRNNMALQDEIERKNYEKIRKFKLSICFICFFIVILLLIFVIYNEVSDWGNKFNYEFDTEVTTYVYDEEGQE